MKSKSLYDVVDVRMSRTAVAMGPGATVEMVNQTCHYLFEGREARRATLAGAGLDGVLVVDCGGSWGSWGSHVPRGQVWSAPESMDALLESLKRLLEDTESEIELETLLIDNISVFYWGLKALNRTNYKEAGHSDYVAHRYYVRLAKQVEEIRKRYKCNVIVTSWDVNFDRGYNSRWRPTSETKLDTLSYLPASYLLYFDYIFHVGREGHRFYNKTSASWAVVGKT